MMRVGIDTYSFHRLHGTQRAGEPPAPRTQRSPWQEDVADARRFGVDALALQTMFLGAPEALDVRELRAETSELELLLSWGGYEGLAFGNGARLDDLNAWLGVGSQLGIRLARIVVGGPKLRGLEPVADQMRRVAPILEQACATAASLDIDLAIENHGDLTIGELVELIGLVGNARLGICLDVANVARLGEEPVAAASQTAAHVRMVHLRDCDDATGADPVAGPRVRRYGEGALPIEEVLATLAGRGFDGPVCVELAQLGDEDEVELVADCVGWLRRSELFASARTADGEEEHA